MGKILAVDDEEEMLELVKMALERDGHQVDTEEDVKRVSAERCRIYDLLLLDVMICRLSILLICVSRIYRVFTLWQDSGRSGLSNLISDGKDRRCGACAGIWARSR